MPPHPAAPDAASSGAPRATFAEPAMPPHPAAPDAASSGAPRATFAEPAMPPHRSAPERLRPASSYLLPLTSYLLCLLLSACGMNAPGRLPNSGEVAGLPLIEVPLDTLRPGAPLVVLLTGDGGWSGRVQEMARELRRQGISTVGWNSLRYYWRGRAPEEAATDLAHVIHHYRTLWRAGPVLLVGYSFGADVAPFLANRLPPAQRAQLAGVAVVGFSRGANFHFFIPDWIGRAVGRSYPTHPEVQKLADSGVPVLCINGLREESKGCDGLDHAGVEVVLLPTGHRFNGYFDEIAGLVARLGREHPPGARAAAFLRRPDGFRSAGAEASTTSNHGAAAMAEAQAGDKVRVHYTGRLDDGSVFDSSRGRQPLEFTVGEGQVIPGFDQAVAGMTPGEEQTITIPADQAYGPRRDELLFTVPRGEFPPQIDPEVGQQLQVQNGDQVAIVTVAGVSDEDVTLDGNHPLAGRDLTFDLELVEID